MSMKLTKCKLNHIKANIFTEDERQVIKDAVQALATRRPNFYHDAIIEKAHKVLKEKRGDIANNS